MRKCNWLNIKWEETKSPKDRLISYAHTISQIFMHLVWLFFFPLGCISRTQCGIFEWRQQLLKIFLFHKIYACYICLDTSLLTNFFAGLWDSLSPMWSNFSSAQGIDVLVMLLILVLQLVSLLSNTYDVQVISSLHILLISCSSS